MLNQDICCLERSLSCFQASESKVMCYEVKLRGFGWCHLSKSASVPVYILYPGPDRDFKCFNRLQMAKENSSNPTV